MPTDAEWEYAAQWDDERIYPWGDEDPDCSCANFYTGTYCVYWTTPVGSYPDAPEVLGLSDMAGNLFEWCNDWWVCNLGTSPETDPTGPGSGSRRVTRSQLHVLARHAYAYNVASQTFQVLGIDGTTPTPAAALEGTPTTGTAPPTVNFTGGPRTVPLQFAAKWPEFTAICTDCGSASRLPHPITSFLFLG